MLVDEGWPSLLFPAWASERLGNCMSEYDGSGVDDGRVALAARRIVRQYHLQQSDRSEDSASTTIARVPAEPDDIHSLRLALDEMSQTIEHLQRLLVNREAVFLATLERIDRNLAKTDGRLDALATEVARVESRSPLDLEAILEDQRSVVTSIMQEYGGMMALGRTLLDEVRDIHAASIEASGRGADQPQIL